MSKNLGIIIIVLVVVAGSIFFWPKNEAPQVAGAHSEADPNHPTEIYYGPIGLYDLRTMAADLAIEIYPEDKTTALPDPILGIGSKITVRRAAVVNVTDAKVKTVYRSWKKNIGELLKEKNIELLDKDSVEPSVNTAIRNNMDVKITRVAEFDLVQKEPIEFSTIKKNDVDLEKGQTRVERAGQNGEKEVTYHIKRVDGEEVSRKVTDTKVLNESTSEILIIGIGPKLVHSGPFVDWLNQAAKETLINATALQCLMLRESGGTPEAGWPDAYYKGLFQYEEGYWASASERWGFGGASIYDARAQIFTTAHEIARGQGRRWPPYVNWCSGK